MVIKSHYWQALTSTMYKIFRKVMHYRQQLAIGAGVLLGVVFIISGAGKIMDSTEFLDILLPSASYLPDQLVSILAHTLPWVELVLGLMLLLGIAAKFAAILSSLLSIAFIFHNTWVMTHTVELDSCGCLSLLEKGLQLAISVEVSRYIDIVMLVLGLLIIFCYPAKFFNLRPWFFRKFKSSRISEE